MLREQVGCAALLEQDGWKVDVKESTRRAIKYRRDSRIVIVIHDGRGWFDPLSTAKGTCFRSPNILAPMDSLTRAIVFPASSASCPARPPGGLPAKSKPIATIAERWRHRSEPRPGSPTWRYLIDERHIPESDHRRRHCRRPAPEGPQGSMWAAHSDSVGVITGWEERGPSWRGFATGGAKELFRLGASDCLRICVTEAAVDAMSLAALEELRDDTLYVSTGGGWAPATEDAIRAWPGAPMSSLSPRLTTIGKVRCTPVAFRKSSTKPALVSRGRGRAPTIGTRTSAPPELAELRRKGGEQHGPVPHARPRAIREEDMRKRKEEKGKNAAACPASASRVKLRPRSAALDPPDRKAAAEEV